MIRSVSCICPLEAQPQELESAALSVGSVQSQLNMKFLSPWLGSEIAWNYKAITQNELQKNKRQKHARCPVDEAGLQWCPKSTSDAKGNCSSTRILGYTVRAQEQGKLMESSMGTVWRWSVAVKSPTDFYVSSRISKSGYKGFSAADLLCMIICADSIS